MRTTKSTKIMVAILAMALSAGAQTVARSASSAISFRAEVAKVLRLQSNLRQVQQAGVSAEVFTAGPSTLRVAVQISGSAPVLRLPVAITSNVRSCLLQARASSSSSTAVIGLAGDPGQDPLGRQVLSRALPLDRDPVFAMVSSPAMAMGSTDTTIELRFDPVPSGETRTVTFELSLLESGR